MGTFSDSPSRLRKASTISTNAVSTTTRTVERVSSTPTTMAAIAMSSTGRRPNRAARTPACAADQVPARYATNRRLITVCGRLKGAAESRKPR